MKKKLFKCSFIDMFYMTSLQYHNLLKTFEQASFDYVQRPSNTSSNSSIPYSFSPVVSPIAISPSNYSENDTNYGFSDRY